MIKAPLRVETARLILSPPTADDVQAIFEPYAERSGRHAVHGLAAA